MERIRPNKRNSTLSQIEVVLMDAGRCGEEQDSGRQLGVEKKAQGLELE